jgi:hypothetical protein
VQKNIQETAGWSGRSSRKGTTKHELLVNVYGRSDLAEDFGSFFEKVGIFLQDPVACQRDVPYMNPHLLANNEIVMTSSIVNGRETEPPSLPRTQLLRCVNDTSLVCCY